MAQAQLEPFQLFPVGKPLVEQQVDDLRKTAKVYQVLNFITAVEESSLLTANIAQPGLVGNNALESFGENGFLRCLVVVHVCIGKEKCRLLQAACGAGLYGVQCRCLSRWRTKRPPAHRRS